MCKSITIANNTGQKSIFRGYSADGNPGGVDATSIRVSNLTNTGAKPFALCEIESGSSNLDFIFRRADLDSFNGSIIVHPTGFVPSQVESYNDVRLRGVSGPNVYVDKVRTTDAAAITNTTLVSDTVMTFPTTPGTYIVDGILIFTAPTAADLSLRFNHAAAATGKFAVAAPGIDTTASPVSPINFATIQINTTTSIGGIDSVEQALHFTGTLVVTTAGTFAIQYAEATASGSLSPAKTLSRLSYRKVS